MVILVTGGAGFIGSAVVRMLIRESCHSVVNVDRLSYSGNLESLAQVEDDVRYTFERADICDAPAMRSVFERHSPSAVIHLAAESHVDRSIDGPAEFVQTNVVGTFTLLEAARRHWQTLRGADREQFSFVHVSTDEVFGSLGDKGAFTETTSYQPNSPYSATKAGSDHLVRAWYHTYGLPAMVTNCSNNYGPYQFPEKLIPLTILNAAAGRQLPVYGRGANVRDWLFVDDHAAALVAVVHGGRAGETYAIGGQSERRNIDVVKAICALMDELAPNARIGNHADLIEFVTDRPGHDQRYAIDSSKIQTELGWHPTQSFDSGLRKTVQWYLDNPRWGERIQASSYRGERLGLSTHADTGPGAWPLHAP